MYQKFPEYMVQDWFDSLTMPSRLWLFISTVLRVDLLFVSWSKTPATALGLMSALYTGRKENSCRARRLRTKNLLERLCIKNEALSPVTFTYISLTRTVL